MLDSQIAELRLQSQADQVNQINRRRQSQPVLLTPTYQGRDRMTGFRRMQTTDGGTEMSRYLANSVPTRPLMLRGYLGRSAIAIQKSV